MSYTNPDGVGEEVAEGDVRRRRSEPRRAVVVEAVEHLRPADDLAHLLRGASSDSRPCSTSCIAAAPVTAFVIEAIQPTVSGVIAAPSRSARRPKRAFVNRRAPRVVASATTPGTSPAPLEGLLAAMIGRADAVGNSSLRQKSCS